MDFWGLSYQTILVTALPKSGFYMHFSTYIFDKVKTSHFNRRKSRPSENIFEYKMDFECGQHATFEKITQYYKFNR